MNIQIFGTKKCNDTKKAQRYFKERGIKFQFIDMSEKEMSKGEFRSVCQVVGGINVMINEDCKDNKIYMHTHAHGEILMPSSAVQQLSKLISENKVVLVNESNLDSKDREVYDATYKNLAKVMINPNKPNKNKGEACSLAYAKATGIPVFATDEKDLQPIIDKQLNTGY